MSAAAQTVAQPKAARKSPPTAKNLRALVPYLKRYQSGVWLGMLMVAGMGITGIWCR